MNDSVKPVNDCLIIVDDDHEIRLLLAEYMVKNGYRCITAANGVELRQKIERHSIDLAILDLMLPGENGLSLCRFLKESLNLPIIMLTALGEETDRIVGLEMGADDYVVKPFSPRELLARVRSVLRRTRSLPGKDIDNSQQSNHFGDWTLDHRRRELSRKNVPPVILSSSEYDLLCVFLTYPGRILERDQLLDFARGRDAMPFDRSIDMQVSRLRKRLDGHSGEYIKTIRGHGYLFVPEVT